MAERLLFPYVEDQNLNLLLSLPGRPHPDPGLFFPGGPTSTRELFTKSDPFDDPRPAPSRHLEADS